ncbi:MAG: hypothetical protein J1E38_06140 [Paramuribaculum sp.]|nr:hypothetical protein [Paramuribaculum sp.]
MKTSFYFVLWIIIYPILGLFDNPVVNRNAFIFALFIVFGCSYLISKWMPKTIRYERMKYVFRLIADFKSDNIESIKNRIRTDARVETFTAIYFIISTFVLLLGVLRYDGRDWISLLIFLLFTIGAIAKSCSLIKAYERLKNNPDKNECKKAVAAIYRIDLDTINPELYSNIEEKLLNQRPKYYGVFRVVSLVIAIICALLGLYFVYQGIMFMFANESITVRAMAGMYFLYGSLAVYYGIKDILEITRKFKIGTET